MPEPKRLAMGGSLKEALRPIAEIMGVSHVSLYEHQRALIREGLIDAPAGRGPGKGTPATPEALAILLLTYVARQDVLIFADVIRRVRGRGR